MPVLTQKELSEKGKLPFSDTTKEKPSEENKEEKPKVVKKKYRWTLMHPENSADGLLQNFEDTLVIDDVSYKRICYRGVVKTTEEALAEFLLFKGYQFLEKEEL